MSVALPRPGRCVVMGVLNVTPDSFSDGGCFADAPSAIAHGLEMHAAGAKEIELDLDDLEQQVESAAAGSRRLM